MLMEEMKERWQRGLPALPECVRPRNTGRGPSSMQKEAVLVVSYVLVKRLPGEKDRM